MSIGRTFKESLQKALRGLETGLPGFGLDPREDVQALAVDHDEILRALRIPNDKRVPAIRTAFRAGLSLEEIHEATRIDRWFLENMRELVDFEEELKSRPLTKELLREAKALGYSDRQIACAARMNEAEVLALRSEHGIQPVYKLVDTCAAEFEAKTPYYYSTWEDENEARPTPRKKIAILGGGPNRIGQGIEFDYCCVQACFELRKRGFEIIMVNSNPETVSTDFDTSDQLFFEPLTVEDVLHVHGTQSIEGAIVQFGGQTPLNIAARLKQAGVKILGTTPEAIDLVEDREKFSEVLRKLDIPQPRNGMATGFEEADAVAARIGYPVVVRPSYVLGGRAMEIVWERKALQGYMERAVEVSPDRYPPIDEFLETRDRGGRGRRVRRLAVPSAASGTRERPASRRRLAPAACHPRCRRGAETLRRHTPPRLRGRRVGLMNISTPSRMTGLRPRGERAPRARCPSCQGHGMRTSPASPRA
jgi:carbamoyl-phosphate synthase large subunit